MPSFVRNIVVYVVMATFIWSASLAVPVAALAEEQAAADESAQEQPPEDPPQPPKTQADQPSEDKQAIEAEPEEKPDEESAAAESTKSESLKNPAKDVPNGEGEARKTQPGKLTPEEAKRLKDNLKIKSRRKRKQTKGKSDTDNVIDQIFNKGEQKDERFNVDYSPSKEDPLTADEDTPFYKHWIFWTIIGVAAVSGVVIGLKYGTHKNETMTLDVNRR